MAPDLASGAIDVALGELPNLGYLGRRLQHAGLEVVASAAFAADPWEMVMPWEGGVRVLRSEPILATGRVLIASPRVPADVVGEMRAAAGRFWVGGPTMSPSNAARERVPIRLLSTVQTSGEALPGLLPVGAASRVSPVREVSAIESWEERGKIVHHALGGGRLYRFRDGMDGTGVLPRDGAREPQPRRRAGRWELGDGLDATKRVFVEQCLPKRVYPVPPELLSEAEAFLGAWERALLGRAQVAR
ncbi:MAG: hypothetical protein JNL97_05185 [Verrucomicrobiales bacterium]|nr:hypothetical protein [Verrucomicrobiales bacterium]